MTATTTTTKPKKPRDVNDRHKAGTLPLDPFEGAVPMTVEPEGPKAERQATETGPEKPAPRKLPEIVVGPFIEDMVDQAERALRESGRAVYHRSGELVRVVDLGKGLKIDPLRKASLLEQLSAVASWMRVKQTDEGESCEPVKPPREVVDALFDRRAWSLPRLEAVVNRPVLRLDGTVVQAPGYDAASRVLYVPSAEFPPIPEHPTQDEAQRALDVLADVFCDFPFVDRCDLSAVLAFVLTLTARHAIDGAVPMFVVRASTPSTGKGLLVDVVGRMVFGSEIPRTAQSSARSRDEEEKRLVAFGRSGTEVVLIDNVERPLGGDVLALALTARTYTGRVLGVSGTTEVPVPVFVATGNNVTVAGDCSRRVIPIDMDAGVERPEHRTRFKHGNETGLKALVTSQRPHLVAAALTVLRWHFASGLPGAGLRPFSGSFESWSAVVRTCLVRLGLPDPVEGNERLLQDGDPERHAREDLLAAWHEHNGQAVVTVPELLNQSTFRPELRDALLALDPAGDPASLEARRLGAALGRIKNRVVGGLRLERVGARGRQGFKWRVVRVEEARP